MNHGNANFLRRLSLCCLCLACFSVGLSAQTVTTLRGTATATWDGTQVTVTWSAIGEQTTADGAGNGYGWVAVTHPGASNPDDNPPYSLMRTVFLSTPNGSYQFVPTVGVTYTLFVRYSTYQQLNGGSAVVIELPTPKQYDVTHSNSSAVPMKVGLYNGDTLIAEVTVPPGQSARLTATVPAGVELTEKFFVQSQFSDGVWLAVDDFDDTPSGTRTVSTGGLNDSTGTPPTTPPPATPPPPTVAAPTGPTTAPSTSGTGVWTTTAATTSAEALDKTTYRQGVDKITSAIAGIGKNGAINVTLGGGGGGGTGEVDTSEIERLLGEINDRGDQAKDDADAAVDDFGGNDLAIIAVDQAQSRATDGRNEMGNAISGAFGSAPSSPDSPGSPPSGFIELGTYGGQQLRIPKNPFDSEGPFNGILGTIAAFIRRLIAWSIVASFMIWLLGRLREMIAAPFNVAPFGTALSDSINSIKIAGTGGGFGYATRIFAFALIFAVILTMPLAVTAAVTAGLPWEGLKETFGQGLGSADLPGIGGVALGLVDQVIPWVLCLTSPIYYFVVQTIILPSQFFWMCFIKFLPI